MRDQIEQQRVEAMVVLGEPYGQVVDDDRVVRLELVADGVAIDLLDDAAGQDVVVEQQVGQLGGAAEAAVLRELAVPVDRALGRAVVVPPLGVKSSSKPRVTTTS